MNVDQALRRLLLAAGLVVLVYGVGGMFVPALQLTALGSLALAGMLGALAVGLGLFVARQRWHAEFARTVLPDVELPLATPAPGSDVDDMVRRLVKYRQGTLEYREQIRDRLGEVAIAVVSHRDDCTRDEAVARLEAGDWTDNQRAAAFFNPSMGTPQPGFVEQLRNDIFSGESQYEETVRETVDAIAEKARVDTAELDRDTPDRDDEDDQSPLSRVVEIISGRDDVDDEFAAATGGYRHDSEYEAVTEATSYRPRLETGHWRGVAAFALVAIGVGVFTFQPAVLLAAVVPVVLAAYARAGDAPAADQLAVERTLSESNPQPGEEVEVTVTVENTGSSTLPDLRLVDRVPVSMRVVDGSPRLGTTLRPGNKASFEYTLVAARGEYSWPLLAVARDYSGAVERESRHDVDAELSCMPGLRTLTEAAVRSQTSVLAGQVDTKTGGAGLEFFSVRDYRAGDPMNRIDWSRHAKTGELATINFREEKAASITLLFDARQSAFVSPAPGAQHAVDRSVQAGGELFASLFDMGNLVGLAAFDTVPCWQAPGAGEDHSERARRLFSTHPALSPIPPNMIEHEGHYVDPMTHVRRQLPASSQVMLFTPLTDDYAAEVARRLDGMGHLVTVISPDPSATRTPGQTLARVERAMRINYLRERQIRVVDWGQDETLGLELDRAKRRWTA